MNAAYPTINEDKSPEEDSGIGNVENGIVTNSGSANIIQIKSGGSGNSARVKSGGSGKSARVKSGGSGKSTKGKRDASGKSGSVNAEAGQIDSGHD